MNQLTNLSPADQLAQHEQEAKDLTRILPASQKVYLQGSRPDLQVPMREIALTDTPTGLGGEKNLPIMVYDTSGVICRSWSMTHQACIPTPMCRLT